MGGSMAGCAVERGAWEGGQERLVRGLRGPGVCWHDNAPSDDMCDIRHQFPLCPRMGSALTGSACLPAACMHA